MVNTNVWVWRKDGKKKPVFQYEKFVTAGQLKDLIMYHVDNTKEFTFQELPPCAEGWTTYKITIFS